MKFTFKKPNGIIQEKEYQETFFNLAKYGENITVNDLKENLIEIEIHLSEETDIVKFQNFIKQKNLFHSF